MSKDEIFIHVTQPHNLDSIINNGLLLGNGGLGIGVYCIRLNNPSAVMALCSLLSDYGELGEKFIGVVVFKSTVWVDGSVGTHQEGNSIIPFIVHKESFLEVSVMNENQLRRQFFDEHLLKGQSQQFRIKYPELYEEFFEDKLSDSFYTEKGVKDNDDNLIINSINQPYIQVERGVFLKDVWYPTLVGSNMF